MEKQKSNWSKVFPSKLETEEMSFVFVKKLLTVAVSNITYIRKMFPEEAYAKKSLDKTPLNILRQKNKCKDAGILSSWLISAFEAIEKKYLKELMLLVHLDPANPDDVYELYTFKFTY